MALQASFPIKTLPPILRYAADRGDKKGNDDKRIQHQESPVLYRVAAKRAAAQECSGGAAFGAGFAPFFNAAAKAGPIAGLMSGLMNGIDSVKANIINVKSGRISTSEAVVDTTKSVAVTAGAAAYGATVGTAAGGVLIGAAASVGIAAPPIAAIIIGAITGGLVANGASKALNFMAVYLVDLPMAAIAQFIENRKA